MYRIIVLFALTLFLKSGYSQDIFPITDFQCKSKSAFNSTFSNMKTTYSWYSSYDVKFYKLELNAERDSTALSGKVTINSLVKSTLLDTFFFEMSPPLLIDSIKVNGTINNNYQNINDEHFVLLSPSLSAASLFSVEIFYHGTPVPTGFFSGISSAISGSWGNEVTWTLSEPYSAKVWWPCKQDLTDKADSAYIFITTSNENKVGSNGLLSASVPLPNNKVRYEWKTGYAIDYYLISFSISKYIEYNIYAKLSGSQDSILIQNYIYDNPACLPYFKNEIDQTADFLTLFSELLGIYPFKDEKYGHSMAPIGGGMEHQTMTTLGFFSFDLVSHELAHMWFGDNVTCASWNDIWINEGWATYGQYLAKQYLQNQLTADTFIMSVHELVQSQPGGSVYIPTWQILDEARIFDGRLSYNKGAAIIHMIRYELDDDSLFFNVIKTFQNLFKDSVATGLDFKDVLENQSGKNFDDFFNQWYFGEGYPIYEIIWGQKTDTLLLTARQFTSTTTTTLFKMPMEYKIRFSGGDTLIRLMQSTDVANYAIPFSKNIISIEADPNHWTLALINSVVQDIHEISSKIQFTIYPNPVNNGLTIISELPNVKRIKIADITGKIIHEYSLPGKQALIDLSDLASGLYILSISDGLNSSYKRFIKN